MNKPVTNEEIVQLVEEQRRARRSGKLVFHLKDGEVLVQDLRLTKVESAYNQP